MKYKTTRKEVVNGYDHIINLGYCSAQALLRNRSPVAYASGVYGWNFDVYDMGDIVQGACIVTGYRSLPKGEKYDYALLQELETLARHKTTSAEREALLTEFITRTLGK